MTRRLRSLRLRTLSGAALLAVFTLGLHAGQSKKTPPAPKPSSRVSLAIYDLHSPSAKRRVKAARALGDTSDLSAIPALVGALSDPSPKVRRQAVLSLANFHVPQALSGLVQATTDSDPTVRDLAIQGAVDYYTGDTPDVGLAGFMARQYRIALRHYQLNPERVDPGTMVDPQVVSALARAMQDTRMIGPAREAAKGLGILMASAAVPVLVAAAHSTDPSLAVESLNSLSKIQDDSVGPQLLDLLDSKNVAVREEAAVIVGMLRTPGALPALEKLYKSSGRASTWRHALEGMAYLGDPAANATFLRALWGDDKPARIYAAEGLARTNDVNALPDLQKVIGREGNGRVRLAIEFAITALGKDDYLSQLVNQLDSATEDDVARDYLIELASRPGFLEKLYPYITNRKARIRRELTTVLMYAGDPSSIPPLEHLTHDRNSDVRTAAFRALSSLRTRLAASGNGL